MKRLTPLHGLSTTTAVSVGQNWQALVQRDVVQVQGQFKQELFEFLYLTLGMTTFSEG